MEAINSLLLIILEIRLTILLIVNRNNFQY